jgi:hypothetical protein
MVCVPEPETSRKKPTNNNVDNELRKNLKQNMNGTASAVGKAIDEFAEKCEKCEKADREGD